MIPTGVLEEHKQGPEAETLYSIGETMASLPSRGASVFQNIQNGGRQTVNSVSKPSLNATLAAKVDCHLHVPILRLCSASQESLDCSPCTWPDRCLGGASVFVGTRLLRCAAAVMSRADIALQLE